MHLEAPPNGGAGGDPRISIQFLEGSGNPLGAPIFLGRCVQPNWLHQGEDGVARSGGRSSAGARPPVSGSNSYMADAKLNAPFAGSQTQITFVLVAVEGTVTTEID